jgi:hypothetical protein
MFKELTVPKMQLSLWYSLITLKRTWIDTVLDSADYHQLFNSRRTGSPGSCGRSTTIACCLSGTTIKGRLTFKRRQVSIRMLAWNWQMRFSGDERHHCVKSVRSGSRLHCWKFLTGKGCCTRCPVSRTRLLRELPSLMKTFLPSKFLLTNFQNIEIA